MSASKLQSSQSLESSVTVQARTTRLNLTSGSVRIRRNGIEFRSDDPIPPWTEMTVDMESGAKKLRCTGVVVACDGNRHAGYLVSMVFTGLSRQSQAQLNNLAFS